MIGFIRARDDGFALRPLGGKALILHTIEAALACGRLERVVVATDDSAIAALAQAAGAEIAQGSPRAGVVVELDPAAPLRTPEDIAACIDLLDDAADAVVSGYEAEKNPYFNIVEADGDGLARISKRPPGAVVARQAAPKVYALSAATTVRRSGARDDGEARPRLYVMPRERALVVEDELDFRLAELLMARAG